MTIQISPARINNSVSSVKNVTVIGHSQNAATSTPAFRGKVWEVKSEGLIKKINWLGDDFSSAMQRLVSGATALMTQPFFDLNNKKTDEKTRVTSTARTLGKIIAGTTTGVLIRQICVGLTKKWTQNEHTEQYLLEKGKKSASEIITDFSGHENLQKLLPNDMKHVSYRKIKAYRGAMGTFAAVVVMLGTNFVIDAPLTTYLTNFFVKKFTQTPEPQKQPAVEGGK